MIVSKLPADHELLVYGATKQFLLTRTRIQKDHHKPRFIKYFLLSFKITFI